MPDLPDDENGGGKTWREGTFPFGRSARQAIHSLTHSKRAVLHGNTGALIMRIGFSAVYHDIVSYTGIRRDIFSPHSDPLYQTSNPEIHQAPAPLTVSMQRGLTAACNKPRPRFNIMALIITYTILGVPYCNCSILQSPILIIAAFKYGSRFGLLGRRAFELFI